MPATPKVREFTAVDGLRVRVQRSARRSRTVQAVWRDGAAVVMVPARLSAAEEERWVETMVKRLRDGRRPGRRPGRTDAELMERARRLNERYLGGLARPVSVRWVSNQRTRWGSATPSEGTIRLSDRLREMPEWVQDHVLVHELAHLVEPGGHHAAFRALEGRYPRTVEAKAYLDGAAFALNRWSDAGAPASPDGEPGDY